MRPKSHGGRQPWHFHLPGRTLALNAYAYDFRENTSLSDYLSSHAPAVVTWETWFHSRGEGGQHFRNWLRKNGYTYQLVRLLIITCPSSLIISFLTFPPYSFLNNDLSWNNNLSTVFKSSRWGLLFQQCCQQLTLNPLVPWLIHHLGFCQVEWSRDCMANHWFGWRINRASHQ